MAAANSAVPTWAALWSNEDCRQQQVRHSCGTFSANLEMKKESRSEGGAPWARGKAVRSVGSVMKTVGEPGAGRSGREGNGVLDSQSGCFSAS